MIPSPAIESIQVGPLTIHFYGAIIALALISCYTLLQKIARSKSFDEKTIDTYFFISLPFAIIGARLYHVSTNWDFYALNPLQIPLFWQGGLGLYGGIAAAVVTLFILSQKYKHNFLNILDLFTVVLPLGQAIGRWGNYFNQELFGKPTNLPWALQIEPQYRPEAFKQFATFHPTFLYESLLNLLSFTILYKLFTKKVLKAGTFTSLYLIFYGLIRLLIESIKLDPDVSAQIGPLRVPQYISLGIIFMGTILLINARKTSQLEKNL